MSLINDALKRASEAQVQAQTRPRGPKGVEDLPVPMTPVAAPERPAWLPIAGISIVIIALLGASGFFFSRWWKERQAWQPYAETPEDPDPNAVTPKAKPDLKPVQVSTKTTPVGPVAVTNPPTAVTIPPAPSLTNPPVAVVVPPSKPVEPAVPVVQPVAQTNPPAPPLVAKVEPNPPPVVIPPVKPAPPEVVKKGDDHATKLASVEFPELKLQGISRRKNKTFAVVNGKTLSLGDRIEGALLLKIDSDSVVFEKGGARRELFLLR